MFIPKGKTEDYKVYERVRKKYRCIEKGDSGRLNAEVLILESRGNPPWDSFQGFRFDHADVGIVSAKMAEIYLIGERVVIRFKRQNGKVMVKR